MDLSLIPDSLGSGPAIFLLIMSTVTSMITAALGAGGGVLLLENPGSLLAQQLRLRRLLGIRTGDVVAALRQDPGDG